MARVSQPLALSLSDITIATNSNVILKSVMFSRTHGTNIGYLYNLHLITQNCLIFATCHVNETFLCYKMPVVEITIISVEKGDVLLCGTRLCIPDPMQKQFVDLAHKGHQAPVKCKTFLRDTFWFLC